MTADGGGAKDLPIAIERARKDNLARSRQLFTVLLQYLIDPSDLNYHSANHLVALIAENSRRPGAADSTDEFLLHTRVVLQAIRDRHEFELGILNTSVPDSLREVRAAYLKSYEAQDHFTSNLRLVSIVLTVIFSLLLVWIFVRLETAKESLAALNHTLEDRVAARTDELNCAMEELEEKQEQLLHASKMSALGEMAGGIAHEINSPLAAISLQTELIANSPHAHESLLPALKAIEGTVGRISKIVSGLRRLAHGGKKNEKVRTNVEAIIADTLSFCSEKLRNSFVELRWNKEFGYEELFCQPEQVSQVLLNLINNAVDAVAGSQEKWIAVGAEVDGEWVRIFVEDSGPPIPEAVKAQIMKPFFTTKAVGKGTGLGLSISRNIVGAHGGKIWLDTDCPHTRFVVELPRG